MTDCFEVRVQRVSGAEVVFDVLTLKAGGPDDYAKSRSFVLLLLHDAIERGAVANPALSGALSEAGDDWFASESWMRANVGRFVVSSELVERRNEVGEAELLRREQEIAAMFGGVLYTDETHKWQPVRWERCHNFTLRAKLTDSQWASHLKPGVTFGTTAFDVWWED